MDPPVAEWRSKWRWRDGRGCAEDHPAGMACMGWNNMTPSWDDGTGCMREAARGWNTGADGFGSCPALVVSAGYRCRVQSLRGGRSIQHWSCRLTIYTVVSHYPKIPLYLSIQDIASLHFHSASQNLQADIRLQASPTYQTSDPKALRLTRLR
jgi:hypothetical protein